LVSDNPTDIGFIDVIGTDADGNPQTETVEMNGTTPVQTIADFCSISLAQRNPMTVVLVNDPNGTTWLIYVLDNGQLQTRKATQNRVPPPIYLVDSDTGATNWILGATPTGDITSTQVPFVVPVTSFQLVSDGDLTFTVRIHGDGKLFTD
jgi:hypothetical protein